MGRELIIVYVILLMIYQNTNPRHVFIIFAAILFLSEMNVPRIRRLRSLSLSSDLRYLRSSEPAEACPEPKFNSLVLKSVRIAERNRNYSVNCIDNFSRVYVNEVSDFARNGFVEAEHFQFAILPVDCKLKVFSYLSAQERGRATMVCSEWYRLMMSTSLWEHIDLTTFKFCCSVSRLHRECTLLCYDAYRRRVTKFLQFLLRVKPSIKSLKFALDVGDSGDGWGEILQELIRACRCKELGVADLNWTETPLKKPFVLPSTSVTWSHSDYKELTFRRRHRQRHFIRFFDLFTACATNVVSLRLPFDWSERSQRAFERLHELRVLTLTRYFNYAHVKPDAFYQLFCAAKNLRRLTLEIWTESYGGFYLYRLHSASLEYLDISSCRGVYLAEMSVPNLEVFRVSRRPLNLQLPLLDTEEVEMPCMYNILAQGAPKLLYLNDHFLMSGWHENTYEELENVLRGICSCRFHKSNVEH